MNTARAKLAILISTLFFFSGLMVHAEQPSEKDVLPILQTLAKSPILGRVLNGPAVPNLAQINDVKVKVLQIQEAKTAVDRQAGKAVTEYKVWPIRVYVVVNFFAFGAQSVSDGESTCYAYRNPQGQWAVTTTPLEIKKGLFDSIFPGK